VYIDPAAGNGRLPNYNPDIPPLAAGSIYLRNNIKLTNNIEKHTGQYAINVEGLKTVANIDKILRIINAMFE